MAEYFFLPLEQRDDRFFRAFHNFYGFPQSAAADCGAQPQDSSKKPAAPPEKHQPLLALTASADVGPSSVQDQQRHRQQFQQETLEPAPSCHTTLPINQTARSPHSQHLCHQRTWHRDQQAKLQVGPPRQQCKQQTEQQSEQQRAWKAAAEEAAAAAEKWHEHPCMQHRHQEQAQANLPAAGQETNQQHKQQHAGITAPAVEERSADSCSGSEAEAAFDDVHTADELSMAGAGSESEQGETNSATHPKRGRYSGGKTPTGQLLRGVITIDNSDIQEPADDTASTQDADSSVSATWPLHDELLATLEAARKGVQQQQGVDNKSSSCPKPQQGDNSKSRSRTKSALHHEVLHFAAAAAPSAVERLVLYHALSQLQQVARDRIMPTAQAILGGSQAAGLALPGSCVDVVLLRRSCPGKVSGAEVYQAKDRIVMEKLLKKLICALYEQGFVRESGPDVSVGRVPFCRGLMPINIPQSELKAAIAEDEADSVAMHYPFLATISRDAASCLTSPQATTQDVDSVMKVMLPVKLSFGDADGVAAVSLMKAQVMSLPVLRPLVLVIKALLNEAGLNDVSTGGLGSYSLVKMVIAHLQVEGVTAEHLSFHGAGSSSSSSNLNAPLIDERRVQWHLGKLAAAALSSVAANSNSGDVPQESEKWDLGCLLHGLFVRFGEWFQCQSDAVSVRAGGIVQKRPIVWRPPGPRDAMMAVEDAVQYGQERLIAGASQDFQQVREALAWAADSLRRIVQFYEGTVEGRQQLAAAAKQLLRKDTTAAAGVYDRRKQANSSDKMHSAASQGLAKEEVTAGHDSTDDFVSVLKDSLQQDKQQQQQEEEEEEDRQQQQYQAGYAVMGHIIDIFGALGRGTAADVRRQALADAVAAAKKRREQQLAHQLQNDVIQYDANKTASAASAGSADPADSHLSADALEPADLDHTSSGALADDATPADVVISSAATAVSPHPTSPLREAATPSKPPGAADAISVITDAQASGSQRQQMLQMSEPTSAITSAESGQQAVAGILEVKPRGRIRLLLVRNGCGQGRSKFVERRIVPEKLRKAPATARHVAPPAATSSTQSRHHMQTRSQQKVDTSAGQQKINQSVPKTLVEAAGSIWQGRLRPRKARGSSSRH